MALYMWTQPSYGANLVFDVWPVSFFWRFVSCLLSVSWFFVWSGLIAPYCLNIVNGGMGGANAIWGCGQASRSWEALSGDFFLFVLNSASLFFSQHTDNKYTRFPNSFHSFHKNVENYWKLPNSFHSFHNILVSWTEVNPFPFCENCENYWVVFNSFRHSCENCENYWEKRA